MRKETRVGTSETNPMQVQEERIREKHESTCMTANECRNVRSDKTIDIHLRKHASPSTPQPSMTSMPTRTARFASIYFISDPLAMHKGKGHRPRIGNASKTKSALSHGMPYNFQSFFFETTVTSTSPTWPSTRNKSGLGARLLPSSILALHQHFVVMHAAVPRYRSRIHN